MERRYTPAELANMSMKQLAAHSDAEGMGIKINKSKSKAQVAKEILRFYGDKDIEAAKANKPTSNTAIVERPANPDFEAKCETDTPDTQTPESSEEPPKDNRGGARPGAGRPKGMDAERARMTHVSDCPHPAIQGALEILFDIWADAVGCPDIMLTKDEAFDLALPWTNVLEYLGWAQRIPVWATVGITCAWSTVNTFKAKARIAREFRARNRKHVESKEVKPDDGTEPDKTSGA